MKPGASLGVHKPKRRDQDPGWWSKVTDGHTKSISRDPRREPGGRSRRSNASFEVQRIASD
jgi:hypothetical protein